MKYRILFILLCGMIIAPFMYSQNSCFTIDLTKAKQGNIPMSSIFDKVEYIPLETHPDGLLTPTSRYYVTAKYIVAIDIFKKACLFDRKTGKFIHQISKEGGGPEEYRRFMLHSNPLDEKNNIIYAHDVTRLKGYDIETGRLKTIVDGNPDGQYLWSLGNDRYIVTVSNKNGNEPIKLKEIDKNGTVYKTYPNYSFFDPKLFTRDDQPGGFSLFYYLENKLYVTPGFLGDTAYQITDETLIPHFVVRTGNKPYAKSIEENSVKDKKILHLVRETSRYIFFNYGIGHNAFGLYCGYYDKRSKQVFVNSSSIYDRNYGFLNDIDGLPVFIPTHINEKQEVIGRIIPEEILEYVERVGTSSLSPRAKVLIKNMQEDDNPIVIIAQPKK
ncbi:6-bladed beta-propeller [Massilibacteroides vaginae]|uniref:6-bladed beta-propeller n=1 Tax=Massilibacteroides vaginae TaxID=1673718 RepID=UPI0015944652|nr:6-bladed beta-propeller [Massilibacteroides vaginae]